MKYALAKQIPIARYSKIAADHLPFHSLPILAINNKPKNKVNVCLLASSPLLRRLSCQKSTAQPTHRPVMKPRKLDVGIVPFHALLKTESTKYAMKVSTIVAAIRVGICMCVLKYRQRVATHTVSEGKRGIVTALMNAGGRKA
jgi:hypothetical protein